MKKTKNSTITIAINLKLKEDLKKIAKENDTNITSLFNKFAKKYVKKHSQEVEYENIKLPDFK